MKKSKVWLGITLIAVAGTFIWLYGLYDLVQSVMAGRTSLSSEDSLFPLPEDTTYRMALKIDPIALTITGFSQITSRNTSGRDLNEIWLTTYPNAMRDRSGTPAPASAYYAGFSPGYLNITSVKVNDIPATCEDLGISCRIEPPRTIAKGEAVVIDLEWMAKIPQAAYRFGSKDGVLLLGNFYPVLNVLDQGTWHLSSNSRFGDPFFTQSAGYMVHLRIPEAYQVVATGSILSIEAEDNGWQSLTIKADMARDFALAAAYNYRKSTLTVDKTSVVGFFAGQNQALEKEVLERAAAAIKYYNCTYGSYDRPQLVLVQAPMKGFQGMEYSGLIFLAEEALQPEYGEPRRAFLIAHEIAHQWWYDMVGNNQLEEPWLDEGLANWSARQYLKVVEYRATPGRLINRSANLQQSLSDMSDKSNYLDTAYQGGEAFWYQLEDQLGEEKVLKVLRSYLATYKFRTATTEDLRRIISQESNVPLDAFFQRWFDH